MAEEATADSATNTAASLPSEAREVEQPLPSQNPNIPLDENPHSDLKSPKTITFVLRDPNTSDHQKDPQNSLKIDEAEADGSEANGNDEPSAPVVATTVTSSTGCRRGTKRKKMALKRMALEKVAQKKLEALNETLKPIPFVPVKSLDFASHEKLLKRLGLWDFVHIEFDSSIRTDLLAQLIASFNSANRCSYVNGVRIMVNRADLARALKLPVKKVSGSDAAEEVLVSEESIRFMENLVSNWILLHDDTWIMPSEVFNWTKEIKEGHLEKFDWARLLWFMVEKELMQAPELTSCYYASHLQCLIKSQREDLLVAGEEEDKIKVHVKNEEDEEEEEAKVDVKMGGEDVKVGVEDMKMGGEDVKMGTEDVKIGGEDVKMGTEDVQIGGEDVKMGMEDVRDEDTHSHELQEHNIELSLGQDNATEKVDVEKEQDGDVLMDFEGCKEDEPAHWLLDGKSNVSEPYLRPCNLGGDHVDLGCEDERKPEEEEKRTEDIEFKDKDDEEQEEDEVEEEEEEEIHEQEGGFHLSPRGISLDGLSSASLIQGMETTQMPVNSGMLLRDHFASDFLPSRDENRMPPGSSSLFGNSNKREINHDNDISHQSHKRLRTDGLWDSKSSEIDMVMDQMHQLMGKARMIYAAKEQACEESSMNQQILLNELQRRDNMIDQLHKAKMEEQQKRQMEVYRLERELGVMVNLLEGYRKALRETNRAFSEYRARCPQLDEPLYKDVGSGGLVLSSMELEKQRLKLEEEERLKRMGMEKKIKEFEAWWDHKFETHMESAHLLANKFLSVENEIKLLKDSFVKHRFLETRESIEKTPESVVETLISVQETSSVQETATVQEKESVQEEKASTQETASVQEKASLQETPTSAPLDV